VLHHYKSLFRLQLQDILHGPCCTLHAALLKPLRQCEQQHQSTSLKPVAKAYGSKQGHCHLQQHWHVLWFSTQPWLLNKLQVQASLLMQGMAVALLLMFCSMSRQLLSA
jgi:hypothetical protein